MRRVEHVAVVRSSRRPAFPPAQAPARRSRIPFLEISEKDITTSATINVVSATAFSQAAVRAFTAPGSESEQGGTLIMTGATSATRGHMHFGAFAAGKHGLRALSQSIAREYGPQGVHVAFVVRPPRSSPAFQPALTPPGVQVIDGTILTRITARMFGSAEGKDPNWMQDERRRLSPDSIARAYLYLHQQTPDAWTLEMDLRPAKEKF